MRAIAVRMRTRSLREGSQESMDKMLWGKLQNYIDLAAEVFTKLPIGDFFRLRLVCKEWNELASDRAFLERTISRAIPSPYFVMGGTQCKYRAWKSSMGSWLLYYEQWARQWSWTRLPPWDCEVGGLLYNEVESFVFNVHTRVFHKLPPLPEPESSGLANMLMTVIGSATSQYNFEVNFLSLSDGKYFIYYSNNNRGWLHEKLSHKLNWHYGDGTRHASSYGTRAMFDGILYVRKWIRDHLIHSFETYNMVDGSWCDLISLGVEADSMDANDIGEWEGRIFVFGLTQKLKHKLWRMSITVWELCPKILPGAEPNFAFFDQMPDDVCKWMLMDEIKGEFGDNRVIRLQTRLFGEFVLVFVALGFGYMTERAVLYNLKLKTWEKVQVAGPKHHFPLQLLLTGARKFWRRAYHPTVNVIKAID